MTQPINHLTNQLFYALLEGGIKPIIKAAYQYYKRPIIIVDSSYKLLAQYPEELVGDFVFDETFHKRSIPQTALDLMSKADVFNYIDRNPAPTFVNNTILGAPRIMGTIQANNCKLGAFSILYAEGNFINEHLLAASLFAQTLSIALGQTPSVSGSSVQLEKVFMQELINGSLHSKKDFELWTKHCPGIMQGYYQMLVAKRSPNAPIISLEYISDLLRKEFKNIRLCVQNDTIYILLYRIKKDLFLSLGNQNQGIRIVNFLHEYAIECGMSQLYECIGYTVTECYSTEEALRLGKLLYPNNKYYSFEEVNLWSMIDKIYQHPFNNIYYHPVFDILNKYDEKNNTELHKTLCIYMKSFKNLDSTSKELDLHRNTLKYRLERIKEISKVDLNDPYVCLTILCGCYMKELGSFF